MFTVIQSQVNRALTEIETIDPITLSSEQRISYFNKLGELENDVQLLMFKSFQKLNELSELKNNLEKRRVEFNPADSEKITVKTIFNEIFEIGPFPLASTTQMDVKKAINEARGMPTESIQIIIEGGKHFKDDSTLIMKTFIKRPCLIHVIQSKNETKTDEIEVAADKSDAVAKESEVFS